MAKDHSSYSRKNGNMETVNSENKDAKINNNIITYRKNNIPKVMVVDDEFDICNLLKMVLQKQGCDVFGFTDPYIALEHFRTNSKTCNLVISDFRMPGMNGIEFLRNIRQINPTTKMLLMSAFNFEEDLEYSNLSKEINVSGFVQKPVSIRQFSQIIKSHIV